MSFECSKRFKESLDLGADELGEGSGQAPFGRSGRSDEEDVLAERLLLQHPAQPPQRRPVHVVGHCVA